MMIRKDVKDTTCQLRFVCVCVCVCVCGNSRNTSEGFQKYTINTMCTIRAKHVPNINELDACSRNNPEILK